MACRRHTRNRRGESALVPGALLAVLALGLLGGCGGSSTGTSTPARTRAEGSRTRAAGSGTRTGSGAASRPAATSTAARRRPPRRRHRRPGPDPGSLPQTSQLPSAGTAAFRAEMRALWHGIQTRSVHAALPAFFPEGAYAQLKAIGDPRGDWSARLVGDYALDIGAAHDLLGAGAAQARLIAVQVPSGYAHWVPPGVCDNSVGYYEVPNARVVYREHGEVRSFGIASMISWRGQWYVVHLGEVLRPVVEGVVDDPQSGPGSSAPSSTC